VAILPSTIKPSPADVQRILKLRVPVIVKLAERKMSTAEVLRLGLGAIIEFSKPSNDPLDMMINNSLIGRGEAVKVGENFGLRIQAIGTPQQLVSAMRG
jgi:flagellar motor switch protein FliN